MEAGNVRATTPTTTTTATSIPITTTTTAKTSQIRVETSYAYTIGGILKMVQIFLNLIGFILIQSSGEHAELSQAVYYSFVSGAGLCFSSILLLFYILRLIQALNMVPWFKVELLYCILWILFHLIAGLLTIRVDKGNFNTAGYFAFAAMTVYALEALHKICRVTIVGV